VAAIERRAAMTVIPRRISAMARGAGFVRPLIDLIGWPGSTIEQTIGLLNAPATQAHRRPAGREQSRDLHRTSASPAQPSRS